MQQRTSQPSKTGMPTHIIGAIAHVPYWVNSTTKDKIYKNPYFKSTKNDPYGIHIYCVHGTADGNGSFKRVIKRMFPYLPTKIAQVTLVAFEGRFQGNSIEAFSKQLEKKINEAKSMDVIVMGHSRGGLVAAYYAEYLAEKSNVIVHSVITICSPFQGTGLAMKPLTWLSNSVHEMTLHSQFLKALNEKIDQSAIPYLPFGAQKDQIVAPDHACSPKHKAELIILDKHGHLSIMSSWRLVQKTLSHILQVCNKAFVGEQLSFQQHWHNVCAELKYLMIELDSRKQGDTDIPLKKCLLSDIHNDLISYYRHQPEDDGKSLGTYLMEALNKPMKDQPGKTKDYLFKNSPSFANFYHDIIHKYQDISPNHEELPRQQENIFLESRL